MIEPLLKLHLEPISRRRRLMQLGRRLAQCWGAAALAGLGLILLHRLTGWIPPLALPLLGAGAGAAALLVWWRSRQWEPDFRQIARRIEERHPELHALLLTAVQQEADSKTGQLGYLQERVIRQAIAESAKHSWIDAISAGRLAGMQCAQLAALGLLVFVLAHLPSATAHAVRPILGGAWGVTVTPGDATIERGSGLVVLARFSGWLPAEAALVATSSLGQNQQVPLAKNLNDPVFGGTIPEVNADLIYHIEYAGQRTRDFKIRVFDYPRLERADAHLTFPDYTGLAQKKIEDTRRVSAVEGSLLDLSLQLNKPVASAKLVAKDKSVVPLAPDPAQPRLSLNQFALESSKSYELVLVDADGRTNKVPAQFVFDVLKNRAPELKLASPRGDQRVSPLEEIAFRAEAWDDFGLRAYGLAYSLAGQTPAFVDLSQTNSGLEKRPFHHLLPMEGLSAQPDQLVSYYVWADDTGPDGQARRTTSDMYFAEVRPFEEIFREGPEQSESESQSQGQPSSQSEKLAELQKQIISATWKLQRQETGAKPSPGFKKDADVIKQSQEQALKQADALKERLEDPRLLSLIEPVEKAMNQALDHLREAADKNLAAPLPPAVAAEQSAYQALLKLQAREHQVSRGRNRSSGGGGQRAQRQLDQLELKEQAKRYETQRQAAPPQTGEQREQLQVLNRLKELARRQQDLNERLNELQTALQEAKTDEEREALRRQLKRLRDEEQEVLRDVDELAQRMNQPQNQSSMAESRRQLEQTRSEVQRAARELDQGAASQALASGTRAQRDLQQLRDDFRKKTSSQFAEEMRQMRSEARQLARNQEEIGQKIEELAQPKRKTLSDAGETKPLLEQLQLQKTNLVELRQNMRQVTEQAETAEPLLSKQLYDTLRKNAQDDTEKSLDFTTELLRRSFYPQAGQFEERARQSIDELKRGVERAAESVLGDDIEALRLARKELTDLAEQVEREMAQANPALASEQSQKDSEQGQGQGGRASRSQAGAAQSEEQRLAQAGGEEQSGRQTPQGSSDRNGDRPGNSGQRQGQANSPGQSQPGAGSQARNSQDPTASQAGSSSGQPSQQKGSQSGSGQGGQRPPNQADSSQQASASSPGGSGQQAGAGARGPRGGDRSPSGQRSGGNFLDRGLGGGPNDLAGPITGTDYAQWSDRLRDVEEMLDIQELRNEIARVREQARSMRAEFKRHSKEPQWPLIQSQIIQPLVEVRSRVAEELARRETKDALLPIDRDPVPPKFAEKVRRYYELLSRSE